MVVEQHMAYKLLPSDRLSCHRAPRSCLHPAPPVTTSTLLFLVAVGCGVLFGLLAAYGQMRDGVPLREVRWTVPAAILMCGCVFGGLAYLLDSGVAETTLYEIEADGSGPTVPEAIAFDFAVEHPGARHDLLVGPKSDSDVTTPADVRVQPFDPGGLVLVDESRTLDPRCEPDSLLCTWDSYRGEFTPAVAGGHRLVVTLLTPDVTVVHVRVGDEAKTDGVRAPGY